MPTSQMMAREHVVHTDNVLSFSHWKTEKVTSAGKRITTLLLLIKSLHSNF